MVLSLSKNKKRHSLTHVQGTQIGLGQRLMLMDKKANEQNTEKVDKIQETFVPLIKDEFNQFKFYGVPFKKNCATSSWWKYDLDTGQKSWYGGYFSLLRADKRGEILWIPLELKTRCILIPSLIDSDLLWIQKEYPDLDIYNEGWIGL